MGHVEVSSRKLISSHGSIKAQLPSQGQCSSYLCQFIRRLDSNKIKVGTLGGKTGAATDSAHNQRGQGGARLQTYRLNIYIYIYIQLRINLKLNGMVQNIEF